ncbi:hypothetical protein F442_01308 [Phytophthora nicotianae P10297]|uniref:BED-type domain-containing protein n=1 Tax=Phytophthora nicotianae P10297 TaxID=1317064 RepID=W3A2P4_PHYNI|nr:hypothetical protein F442_01308 [Phytophthora nicotianae P10297]
MLSSPAARSSAPSASTDGPTQSASAAVATSKSPPTKCGRRKGPAWDEVIAADGIVFCKKCERIIRQMGETHVERVRHRLQKKSTKRHKLKPITS